MEYVNVFASGPGKVVMYDRRGCKSVTSKCGRGQIVTVCTDWYDYLVNGRVVTQRCGKNVDILNSLIGCILDGEAPKDSNEARALEIYKKHDDLAA